MSDVLAKNTVDFLGEGYRCCSRPTLVCFKRKQYVIAPNGNVIIFIGRLEVDCNIRNTCLMKV